MHAIENVKNWSHHLHDGMLNMCHHIDQHLHSRAFWTGVIIALVIVSLITLVVMLSKRFPVDSIETYPLSNPYMPYR